MANEVTRRNNYGWGIDPFFDNLEDRFFGSLMPDSVQKNLKTDIEETDKAYIAKVDLPGVDKKDIHLNYSNGVLNINCNKQEFNDHEDKNGNVLMSERNYGTMSRSYRLPNVDQSKINAEYQAGVLKVTLPKTTETQNTNNIEIQ
ncbi:Hsp20/alpha crystallin family protein [Agrilactobacillus yilanensis]|uniref:Hsp20/alpha crystallin family protein n=1 Tax=Agrilactobacillus yilanensis TaxID=2485997 RepID=A0ABW4J349_9LACO|nr:Hsp20/alpha crystallin family protein [Agrilactobacillus yilanensis]